MWAEWRRGWRIGWRDVRGLYGHLKKKGMRTDVDGRDSFVRWLCEVMTSEWTKKRHHVVMTYVIFSSHPRLHCGPASLRCPLSSKNTEERCLMDSHGPGR